MNFCLAALIILFLERTHRARVLARKLSAAHALRQDPPAPPPNLTGDLKPALATVIASCQPILEEKRIAELGPVITADQVQRILLAAMHMSRLLSASVPSVSRPSGLPSDSIPSTF